MHSNKKSSPEKEREQYYKNIVDNPDDYTGKVVKEAAAMLAIVEIAEPTDELPF